MGVLGLVVNMAMGSVLHAHGPHGGHDHAHGHAHGHGHGSTDSCGGSSGSSGSTRGSGSSSLFGSHDASSSALSLTHGGGSGGGDEVADSLLRSASPESAAGGDAIHLRPLARPSADNSLLLSEVRLSRQSSTGSADSSSGAPLAAASSGSAAAAGGELAAAGGAHVAPRHENMNVQAAFLHVLGDALQNVGVIVAGAVIWAEPEYRAADPIITFLFAIIVAAVTIGLVRDIFRVLMASAPSHIDVELLEKELLRVDGVLRVTDLHVWSLSYSQTLCSVHLAVKQAPGADLVLRAARRLLKNRWNVQHSTVQVEW